MGETRSERRERKRRNRRKMRVSGRSVKLILTIVAERSRKQNG
jgi:hypothetical protein